MRFLLLFFLIFSIPALGQSLQAHLERGRSFMNNEEYENALKEFEKVLEYDPIHRGALIDKAFCLVILEEDVEAYEVYDLLVRTYPEEVEGYIGRGSQLNRFMEFEKALADFNKAYTLADTDSIRISVLLNRGSVKMNVRNFQGAYNDYHAAYLLDTLNPYSLNNMAMVTDETGRPELTLFYLKKSLVLSENKTYATSNIGFAYQERGNYDSAIHYFNKLLELEPSSPLGYSNRAYSEYKIGKLEKALEDVNISLELYPTNSYALRTRALIHIENKNFEAACADIDRALELKYTVMYGTDVEELRKKYCTQDKK